METQTIGKRITALRKEKGMTQEQLAERLGVSPQAVSKWENDISCPDISILSSLALELGVSTDELLGAKPIEPKVVVVDTNNNRSSSDSGKGFTVSYGGAKKEGIWFAVALILVGLAFLLSRTNILPGGAGITFWNIVWPAVLIGTGVSWFVHDFSPLGLGVGLLGLYFLLFNLGAVTFTPSWGLIWPILIILFGLTILLDKLVPDRHGKWHHGLHVSHNAKSEYSINGGFLTYECAFSEENYKVESDEFFGADIDVSFGKGVLDFTGVKNFRDGARIDADVSFGTVELLVPRSIRVQVDSSRAFGAIQQHGQPSDTTTATVLLCGDVSFGSLELRYI